jgi:DNA polymerase III sliding clamp (beta) subunit (PCNA family)
MQISKFNKIDKCVSKDETRYVLKNPYLICDRDAMPLPPEKDKAQLVATDGKKMVILHVDSTHLDKSCNKVENTSGMIPVDAIKTAQRDKVATGVLGANGNVTLPSGQTFTRDEYTFPNVKVVFNASRDETKVRIGLNAKFLYDMAQALGSDELVLEITDPSQGIHVAPNNPKGNDGRGILMPVRCQ